MHRAQQRVETSLQFIVLNLECIFFMLVGEANTKASESVFCQLISFGKKLLQQIPLSRRMHSLKWNFIKLKISDTVANFTAMYVYIQ
jgi:uncharacterized membrane protein